MEYAKDGGFYFCKIQGLLSKTATQRGILRLRPLDLDRTVWIRTERGIGEKTTRTVADGGDFTDVVDCSSELLDKAPRALIRLEFGTGRWIGTWRT